MDGVDLKMPRSDLLKFDPIEPTFTLRAQDSFAAGLVERWANLAEASRCPAGKVLAARAVARAMFEWRTKKLPD